MQKGRFFYIDFLFSGGGIPVDIARHIGNNIKHYRTQKNLSIQELADAVCKSRATMYKYENGQIIMDINTLYDLAGVLEVPVDHLLYQPPLEQETLELKAVPAFFTGVTRLYAYYYDGRRKTICESLIDMVSPTSSEEPGVLPGLEDKQKAVAPGETNFDIRMYMDILDEKNFQICGHTYTGRITHYGALTNMVFQNYNVRLEQYIISVPSPYIAGEEKWALAFGISSHPLMPTSAKLLLSKNRLKKTRELAHQLTISKEDIRLLKLYNMFVVL